MKSLRMQVEHYFNTGDCKGCGYYDEYQDCNTGHCENIRVCILLDLDNATREIPYTDCKQLKGEKNDNSD